MANVATYNFQCGPQVQRISRMLLVDAAKTELVDTLRLPMPATMLSPVIAVDATAIAFDFPRTGSHTQNLSDTPNGLAYSHTLNFDYPAEWATTLLSIFHELQATRWTFFVEDWLGTVRSVPAMGRTDMRITHNLMASSISIGLSFESLVPARTVSVDSFDALVQLYDFSSEFTTEFSV